MMRIERNFHRLRRFARHWWGVSGGGIETGVLDAPGVNHNKTIAATYLLLWVGGDSALSLLHNSLGLYIRSVVLRKIQKSLRPW